MLIVISALFLTIVVVTNFKACIETPAETKKKKIKVHKPQVKNSPDKKSLQDNNIVSSL